MSENFSDAFERSPEELAYEDQLRRRRRKVLLIAAVASVSVLGIFGVRYVSLERAIAGKRASAVILFQSHPERIGDAVDDLRAVIQRHPKDIDALSMFARASTFKPLPNRQHLIESLGTYFQLLDADPDRRDDRLALVRLLDQLGESEALVRAIEPLLQGSPPDSEQLQLNTLHLLRLGKKPEAMASAQRWVEADPNSLRAYITYLATLVSNGKDQRASDSYLNTVLQKDAKSDAAIMARAAWLVDSGDREEGAALLNELLAKPAWDRQLARYVIFTLDQLGRQIDADQIISTLSLQNDDALATVLTLRDIDRGRYAEARARLTTAPLPANPSWRSAQLCVGSYLEGQLGLTKDAEQSKATLEAIPIEHSGPWIAALRAMQHDKLDETLARELLGQMRVSVQMDEVASLLQIASADCFIALKQYKNADQLLVNATRMPSGWSIASRRLVDLRLSRGETLQAIEVAQVAFDRSGRSIDSAVILALSAAHSQPTGEAADRLLALLKQIHQVVPTEQRTLGPLIEMLAERNDSSAKSLLREALTTTAPIPTDRLLAWAEISEQWGLGSEEECLRRAEASSGLTPEIALARAVLERKRGNTDSALQALRAARMSKPGEAKAFDIVIATFLSRVRSSDAPAAWIAIATNYPTDLDLQLQVLASGVAQSPEQLKPLVDRIRQLDKDNPAAELTDISLSLLNGSNKETLDNALIRLNRLVERLPELIPARLLLINALIQSGNETAAMAQWESAQTNAPNDTFLLLAGASLQLSAGNRPKAEELLGRLDVLTPNMTTEQRVHVARMQLQLGHADRAVAAVQGTPTRSRAENLVYAEALFRSGDRTKGQSVLDSLLVDPDLETLLFAASVADSTGDRARAEQLLLRAETFESLIPENRLRIAQALTDHGSSERVLSFIATGDVSNDVAIHIASRWAERGEIDVAMSVLQAAATKSKDAAPLTRRLELRDQANALVNQKLPQIAARLIESPDDSDTKILVEFARLAPTQSVREQQDALDQLADRTRRSYVAQMFVAERYLATNQPKHAERAARNASELQPASPQPFALTAITLYRAGSYGGCADAIEQWRNRLPADSTIPDVLEARSLAKRREYSQLLTRFESPIRNGTAVPNDMILLVAEALLSRNRTAEANALAREVIQLDSAWSIAWMRSISTELTPDLATKALAICHDVKEQRSLPEERIEYAIAADRIARRARQAAVQATAAEELRKTWSNVDQLPLDCIVRIAEHYLDADEPTSAESLCRAALKTRADSVTLWRGLAQALRVQAKMPDALEAADRAIQLSDRNALAHEIRAVALADLKRYDDAIAAARKASELEPINPRYILRLAVIQLSAGHREEAIKLLPALEWFVREPDAWPVELIKEFDSLSASLRKPTTLPS